MKIVFCLFLCYYSTFLSCMITEDEKKMVVKIFKDGTDLDIKKYLKTVKDLNSDIEGHTPLVWAIICEREEIVKYLVRECSVDINKVSGYWGETPFHWAVFSGNMNITKLLYYSGADFLVTDKWGKTPMDYQMAFSLSE